MSGKPRKKSDHNYPILTLKGTKMYQHPNIPTHQRTLKVVLTLALLFMLHPRLHTQKGGSTLLCTFDLLISIWGEDSQQTYARTHTHTIRHLSYVSIIINMCVMFVYTVHIYIYIIGISQCMIRALPALVAPFH